MNTLSRLLVATLACLVSLPAAAHYPRESYVYLDVTPDTFSGRLEITLADLNRDLPLDSDSDGTVSREEFEARAAEAYAYLQSRLTFFKDGSPIDVVVNGHKLRDSDLGTWVFLQFHVPGLGTPPDTVDVEFDVPLRGVDTSHKSRLIIENNYRTGVTGNEAVHALIIGHGDGRKTLSLVGLPWTEILLRYLAEGAWHIWIGLDHILFLVALLLVSVMVRDPKAGSGWAPCPDLKPALLYLLKVVTLFTVAHSVTLCLSAAGLFRLPVTPVEVLIALSIAVAAWNNLRPLLERRIWWVVFGFGLLHGFGFANVLIPLGLSSGSLVASLIGFNLGVELGQLVIVLIVFPVLFALRTWSGYQQWVLRGGSVALIAIALFWVVERSLGWVLKQDFTQASLNAGTSVAAVAG